jgi:hypothetical protein
MFENKKCMSYQEANENNYYLSKHFCTSDSSWSNCT